MSFDCCKWVKERCFKYLCLHIMAHTNCIKRTLQLFQEIHSSGWNIPYVPGTYMQQGALRWPLGQPLVVRRCWCTYGVFHPWLMFPSFHCLLQYLEHLLKTALQSKEIESHQQWFPTISMCISFFLGKVIFLYIIYCTWQSIPMTHQSGNELNILRWWYCYVWAARWNKVFSLN